MATPAPKVPALLTLDVEDWEHANFAQLESRGAEISTSVAERRYQMDANTDRWIQILGAAGARSTCFVLGEFARRYPDAVKRLATAGHEIATHGDTHDLVYQMIQSQFREFLKRGIGTLGELIGRVPEGFRAPSWSVDSRRTPWLCEELLREGIRYDSSLFPVKTPLFGQSDAPLAPNWDQGILRVPVVVLEALGARLPFSSGAFFRLAPLPLIRFGFWRATRRGLPSMIVLHPRELDANHPRLPLHGWEAAVHYARLGTVVPKLTTLLGDRPWVGIAEAYRPILDSPGESRGQSLKASTL